MPRVRIFICTSFLTNFNADWESNLLTFHLTQQNGFIEPPTAPGLGADLNLDEIARHPYQQGNFLPLFRTGWERRKGFQT